MIIRMAKVEIIGPKDDLMPVLEMLRGRGVFQPDPQLLKGVKFPAQERPKALILDEDDLKEREYFQALLRRVKELIGLLPAVDVSASPLQPLPVMDVLDQMVDQHLKQARSISVDLNRLRQEEDALERDLVFWQALTPLTEDIPEHGSLEMLGVTIRDATQLAGLEQLLQSRTAGRCYISTTRTEDGLLVGLIATDRTMAAEMREALTAERVPEQTLPEGLAKLPLPERINMLTSQLAAKRKDRLGKESSLQSMAQQWLAIYRRAGDWLEERLALYQASAAAYATQQCFVVQGWMAADQVSGLEHELGREFNGRVVLEEQAIVEEDLDRVPVSLRNTGYFAPFELFSQLLPLPKYTSYDPTPFIGLFFPVLFGMTLGDIGYGLILLPIGFLMATRFPGRRLVTDLGKVLGVSAVYTILFGLLFGELFGNLGETWLGLHPIWVDRSKAVVPMIAFALTVGIVHIALGLLFGFWSDLRRHERREALFRLTMLTTILLLALALVAWLNPRSWLATGPLLASVSLLLPVLFAAGGLLAPLELLKTIGNIISYVRIMAIGLSSVLLAVVANQLGGMTGDVLLGILVAGLLHLFNLLLGVFAPTVHALRLHYVEFFSKFLDLGGRRFEPWRKNPL
ncbi:MAG: ATPase [Deltaproteobacteria bacterium]|jgi:V/A-type H+-transporting ATPase subunit I|nr:ATPase [Deltaproteobacteria bacterium]